MLHKYNAHFNAVYCCSHTNKKPLAGMVNQACNEFEIDIHGSYVIGDMGATDMVLAKSIGS